MLTKIISNITCFLYPAYASYKALSLPESSPEGQAQVERWLMYWAVIGCWTVVEAVLGWVLVWIPFYTIGKTLVFLYLSLPTSDAAGYIYRSHLAPLFHEHEADIDAFLSTLRTRLSSTLASALGWAWDRAKAQLNVNVSTAADYGGSTQPGVGVIQPPTMSDPASGAVQQVYGLVARYAGQPIGERRGLALMHSYMPLAIAALSAAASSATARTPGPTTNESAPSAPTPRPSGAQTPETLRSRTYQHATARPLSSHHDSEESLHSTSSATNRWGEMSYEQIRREDVHGVPASGLPIPPRVRPEMDARRSSWFGWGGAEGSRPKAE